MRAMTIPHFGDADLFTAADLPDPAPGPGQVLVRVSHAGVNPVDHKMRDGSSKFVADFTEADFPFVLGREASGVVEALGEGVDDLAVGDAVFGIADSGCYAELALMPAEGVATVPEDGDLSVFGGLALAGSTAWNAVHDLARVSEGDVVLVHGGGGGVGQIMVQLAKQAGAEVWTTASARHAAKLARWGVGHIDYETQDFTRVCPPPTVVLDGVYFGTYEKSIEMLSPGDRMVVLPTLADLGPAQEAGLEVSIPSAAPRPGRLDKLAAMVAEGRLEIEVGQVLALEDVAEAHRLVEAGHAPGKVVLEV